uniref:Gustatory receptor n=1 Tax=Panagrolaimus sp. JU765 TaxID=591449 RepID=A0AC34QSV6_9BILA
MFVTVVDNPFDSVPEGPVNPQRDSGSVDSTTDSRSSTDSDGSTNETLIDMGGRLKIGGYVEPKPLEEMDIKVVPASPPADSPPSYDSAVAQARAEQKLIGTVLLKTSHYFGMHPFKDPYTCDGVVCKKRSLRDRLCIGDFLLCVINLIVVINHFRIHLFYCHEQKEHFKLFSSEKAQMFMTTLDSALPMVCIFGMIFTSYHMHTLLRRLTDAHFNVVRARCMRYVKFWRIVLYVIQFFFAFGAVIEILQNLMIELHPAVVTNTTHITMMPLKELDHVTEQASVFIDRYYFPIINFGVVKIPQLFIMMIALRITIIFRVTTYSLFTKSKTEAGLTATTLRTFFIQWKDVIEVLQSLECCFNKLIFAIVFTSVAKIIFSSYITVRELSTAHENGIMFLLTKDVQDPNHDVGIFASLMYAMNPNHDVGIFASLMYAMSPTCSIFNMFLNIVWTVIFVVPLIWCNEESRNALPILTSSLVESDEAKRIKDQIIHRIQDHTWGLTLGKFCKIDRAFAVSVSFLLQKI